MQYAGDLIAKAKTKNSRLATTAYKFMKGAGRMATVKQKDNKDGSVSYEIRVSLGRDINGKQILKYHSWKPQPGMTQRQTEKALDREAVLFEEKCKNGQVLDTSIRFADFADKWLESYKNVHSPAYQKRAKSLLVRINARIGHLQLDKLRPHHLQALFSNLSEPGEKKTTSSAITYDLSKIMKERSLTRSALAVDAKVAPQTITAACQKKRISLNSACKIALALEEDVETLFQVEDKKET